MKRIYLFNIVAWNYRKKTGFPVCKKENFAGLQAHRKRGKSARASPTPHHTLNEERSARFTAQPLSALIRRFARPVPQLCMTSTMVMDYLYTHWSHLLTSLNQPWLSPDNLETFAINATFQAGGSFAELFWICRWNGQTCFPTRQTAKIKEYCITDTKKFTP